jgi:hypothetical protein
MIIDDGNKVMATIKSCKKIEQFRIAERMKRNYFHKYSAPWDIVFNHMIYQINRVLLDKMKELDYFVYNYPSDICEINSHAKNNGID